MILIHKIPTKEEKEKVIKIIEKSLINDKYEECLEEQNIKIATNKLFIKKIDKNFSSISMIVEVNNQITAITINDNQYKLPKL